MPFRRGGKGGAPEGAARLYRSEAQPFVDGHPVEQVKKKVEELLKMRHARDDRQEAFAQGSRRLKKWNNFLKGHSWTCQPCGAFTSHQGAHFEEQVSCELRCWALRH